MKTYILKYLVMTAILLGFFYFIVPTDSHAQLRNYSPGSQSGQNGHYNMGYRFTPTSDGQITQLWCYGRANNTVVKLYTASGSELASTTINCPNQSWVSSNITPVSVTAGTYYVVAGYANGTYWYFSGFNGNQMPQTLGNITIADSRYAFNSSAFPTTTDTLNMYGYSDVTFVPSGESYENQATVAKGASATGIDNWFNTPTQAIDENDSTYWMSTTWTNDDPWLMVDLGSEKEIHQFRLLEPSNECHRMTQYRIESSNNASSWTTRYTSSTNLTGGDTGIVNLTSASARYWRITSLAGAGSCGTQIHTFGLYGPAPTPTPTPTPVGYSEETFNSTSTWTAPSGVTQVSVACWGAGGGGKSSPGSWLSGGGGGGGAYAGGTVSVTPGNNYTVSIGTGGSGGQAGGDSYFNNTSTILAKGGGSGSANASGGSGGSSSSSVGATKYSGGDGGNAGSSFVGPGGGGGSATASGNGSNGGNGSFGSGGSGGNGEGNGGSDGQDGSAPGGGGGGSPYSSSAVGSGANGRCILSWTAPTPTPTPAAPVPTNVSADAETNVGSYKVTLNGSANPNNRATTMHFRLFTSDPGTCTEDTGGTRVPLNSSDDLTLTTNNSTQQKSFTTGYGAPGWLTPDTDYWYCTYATNTAGTAVSSTPQAFTTEAGAESPCDAPIAGNHTVYESCSFSNDADGVDDGSGASNTGVLTVATGANLTVGPAQKIARGSLVRGSGASITLAEGASIIRGGIWIHDNDGDFALADDTISVSSTQPEGFRRRSYYSFPPFITYTSQISAIFSAALDEEEFDCDDSNANIFTEVDNLVVDADKDGYKTSAAASTQCVGASMSSARTYYADASGEFTYLVASDVLGGGATDCYDNSAAPCPPNTPSISNTTSNSVAVNWTPGTGPSANSYTLRWCSGASCTPSSVISGVSSGYSHTGRTCNTLYRYDVVGVNTAGSSVASSIGQGSTNSCGGGGTWVNRNNAANAGSTTLRAAAIGPDGTMLVVGNNGFIKTSTNGGASWTDRKSAAGSGTTPLYGAAIGPDGTMLVVGESGFIKTSTNGGASWTDRKSAAGSGGTELSSAAIGPDGTMLVVGSQGYIRTSTNGGSNWSNRNSAASAGITYLGAASIGPDGTMLVVGEGYARTSTNGGSSWSNRASAIGISSSYWLAGAAVGSDVMIAAGWSPSDGGMSYARSSTNGGSSWSSTGGSTVSDGQWNSVSIGSTGIILMVGEGGHVRTSDGTGSSWTDRRSAAGSGSTGLNGAAVGPNGEMLVVGDSGYIRTSTE